MASEDFVIDIGLNLNDKEIRSQLQELRSSVIKPFQADFAKTINRPFNMAQRTKLVSRGISAAEKVYNIHSGAITPFEAVRMTLKGSQKTGTPQREMQDEMVAGLKTKIKRNNIIREQEVKSIRAHLKEMGGYTTPLESIQQQIRQETFDKMQQQINEFVEAKNAEERRLAIEEHQKKILEIIAKNTGVFKKWAVTDKAIIQREQGRILSSKRPGEELSEYQKKVMDVSFGGDLSKTVAKAGGILALVTALSKLAYNEATRESSLFNKQAATTGYSLPKERLLSRMGVSDPVSAMSDIATFYDRARLGELPFEGFGMFAPQTYATRMRTQDPLAIWRAFKADVAAGEAKGWSRETIAQKTGMQAWLPTLNKTEEQVRKWAAEVESGKYQDERAQVAYDIKTEVTNILEMLQDTRSKHKTGMWAGGALGAGLGIAAGVALAPVTGAAIALASTLGTGGAVVGANAVPAILETPDVAGDSIKSDIDALWDGRRDTPNVTLNMTVDREVIDEINNGGKYTRTFSGSQISELY